MNFGNGDGDVHSSCEAAEKPSFSDCCKTQTVAAVVKAITKVTPPRASLPTVDASGVTWFSQTLLWEELVLRQMHTFRTVCGNWSKRSVHH